ncbi:MAG: hypothetical protein ACKPKO_65795, partial [Candidatus Fonsibacter sp.]
QGPKEPTKYSSFERITYQRCWFSARSICFIGHKCDPYARNKNTVKLIVAIGPARESAWFTD